MSGPSHSLQPLHVRSVKDQTSSISMKIKTLIHSHIFRFLCRIIRALTKAKSLLIELLKDNQSHYFTQTIMKNNMNMMSNKNKKKNKKKIFSSFRMHYNWCSSHVLPMPEPVVDGLDNSTTSHGYYDSTWNSYDGGAVESSQLSGYLRWLEEKDPGNSTVDDDMEVDEIDRLADMFIASCHEKFRLEKQESYRRYQEMMARSI